MQMSKKSTARQTWAATGSVEQRFLCRPRSSMLVLWVGLWLSLAAPSEADIRTGHYEGNGTSLSVTGLGFQPDFVTIKGDTAEEAVARTSTMTSATNNTKPLVSGAALTSNLITSLDTDGFSVGSDARVNSSGVEYHWVAFKAVSGEIAVGSYSGDDVDNRIIDISATSSSTDFQPDYVWVMADLGEKAVHRPGRSPRLAGCGFFAYLHLFMRDCVSGGKGSLEVSRIV